MEKHDLKTYWKWVAFWGVGFLWIFTPLRASAEELSLYSTAAVLMDAESGRILYEKNAEEPLANASTTKIMTCILILENCELEETVTISSLAASMPKVNMAAVKGDRHDVKTLLYSLMLESHNDSAVALAEHLGKRDVETLQDREEGSFTIEESKQAVTAFAKRMNEKARELGCEGTYFITPNGLDATESISLEDGSTRELEHHTTAADLAKIMAYCILRSPKKETFLQITGTPEFHAYANGRAYVFRNHNSFLSMMEGAFSGKTGFTGKAGYCYVGALRRDERTYVVSLLGCGWPNNRTYKWQDARKLLEYGLKEFERRDLLDPGLLVSREELSEIPVLDGQGASLEHEAMVSLAIRGRDAEQESFGVLLRPQELVETRVLLPKQVDAPVFQGQKLGEIWYLVEGTVYRKEDLVSADSIAKIDLLWCIRQVTDIFLRGPIRKIPFVQARGRIFRAWL